MACVVVAEWLHIDVPDTPADAGLLEIFVLECAYFGCLEGISKDGRRVRGRFSLNREELERANSKKYCRARCKKSDWHYRNVKLMGQP